jgi:hypothetical protein
MNHINTFVAFVPKAGRAAAHNRSEFVRFCRDELDTFGHDLPFNDTTWNVSPYFRKRGKNGNDILSFTQFRVQGERVSAVPEPLGSFARSYIRYICAQKKRNSLPHKEFDAFRLISQALAESGFAPDIGLLDARVLNRAVELAQARWSGPNTVSGRVNKLAEIAKFLRKKNLTDRIHQPWRHNVKNLRAGRRSAGSLVEQKASKLISREVINALANSYHMASEGRDIILTSTMALLVCAPSRVNEIFALSKHCEVDEILDGTQAFGLRWAGSKKRPDHVKTIINVFKDVAQDAVGRIRRHTEEARRIAAWYESNPGRLFLTEDCAHLRDRDLTQADVQKIMGMRQITAACSFLKRSGVPSTGFGYSRPGKRGPKTKTYDFADVERAIVSLLPQGFPILDPATNLRYSEALLVTRLNEFGNDSPWRCMVTPVTYQNIANGFGRRSDGRQNVFDRLGLSTKASPLLLTSHQIRHYLNNLANHADVSQLDIAAWSGRIDITQNRDYDNETGESFVGRQRAMERQLHAVGIESGSGTQGPIFKPAEPVSRVAIAPAYGALHVTELGYCEHDFSASPCPIFMDHLHCTDHVCIKGHSDPDKVGYLLACATQSLECASNELSLETFGATDWVDAQNETVVRLSQLHSILNDPAVPNGAEIRLAKSGRYTVAEQAMRDHKTLVEARSAISSAEHMNVKQLKSFDDVKDKAQCKETKGPNAISEPYT